MWSSRMGAVNRNGRMAPARCPDSVRGYATWSLRHIDPSYVWFAPSKDTVIHSTQLAYTMYTAPTACSRACSRVDARVVRHVSNHSVIRGNRGTPICCVWPLSPLRPDPTTLGWVLPISVCGDLNEIFFKHRKYFFDLFSFHFHFSDFHLLMRVSPSSCGPMMLMRG